MTEFKNVFVVLHNVHAVSKVIDTAQVVYGLGFSHFIVSKSEGTAAQTGVPDANKLAFKLKGNFMVFPDLPDVIELLEITRPLLLVSPKLTKARIQLNELSTRVSSGEPVMIVLSGSPSSFSRKEMDLGECVSLDSRIDIGPAATASIILHSLKRS
ncbi:MAG: RecB-family nuclease [Candidatus Thorarchaeota archaeon]